MVIEGGGEPVVSADHGKNRDHGDINDVCEAFTSYR